MAATLKGRNTSSSPLPQLHKHIPAQHATHQPLLQGHCQMMPRLRQAPLLFITSILFLFLFHCTSGEADSIVQGGVRIPEPSHEVISSRKLGDMTLDYDYGGPNKKHDPPKGKPGIGSKGP